MKSKPKLRLCKLKGCNKWFLPRVRTQRYCSARHRNRVAQRVYRGKLQDAIRQVRAQRKHAELMAEM